MADLIRALEADLFGAHEWAADLYAELADVPEPVDRSLVLAGLFRALETLERTDEATDVVEKLGAAEDAVAADVRARLGPLWAARSRLLDAEEPAEQAATLGPAYLALFDPAWAEGPREPLVADACLAALVRANLIASRGHAVPGAPDAQTVPYQRAAGDLYAAAAGVFEARVRKHELVWQETARSAWHRATVAWRAAGDEQRARVADEAARGLGAGAGSYR